MSDPNLPILEAAATKLDTLADKVVFVGGATLGLLINDAGAAPIRPTIDVDVIAEITTQMEYFDFSEKLRGLGFKEDSGQDAPNCRWLNGELILDVMPLDKTVLGFTNRWYKDAHRAAVPFRLPNGRAIKVISAPYFLGTKVEAFCGRGNRDFYSSRDLEDFISVLDGRPTAIREIEAGPPELRGFLSDTARELLAEPRFLDALPGYFLPDMISQQRFPRMLAKLKSISSF